ncbi:XdhC/CoxI family protein [uncultured Winogradskyella sp.]|uniref:XdhC family protein n=1 Tax=uncultured Winogradskyella sp. TaxID=395353 RepID=UPI00261EA3EC|nr:XdhC/CoxI family protein [uncultured Winogradskyella sp.]
MIHEFKSIITQAIINERNGLKSVMATVVFLEGSSYRKPGVRMLISENGIMTGAVSGGCVENEIKRRASTVFKDNIAKIITYDGRYRLGCEGVLYILIEPFRVSEAFISEFEVHLNKRQSLLIESYYKASESTNTAFGSVIVLDENRFVFSDNFNSDNSDENDVFSQVLQPPFRLLIIGGEHDSVKLCTMASLLGWNVDVVTSIKDPKCRSDFPGSTSVSAATPDTIDFSIDNETAVVLMTHNYVKDLKYLIKLEPLKPKYIGILGSSKRKAQLQNELVHFVPDISESFFDIIFSPAGLHIGSITPEEIALSILSEILAVVRGTKVSHLKSIKGKIHT